MYRTIETSIWSDPAFKTLPPDGKLLFVYLITNPHTHVSGIYYIPGILMSLETGISESKLDTLWDTLYGAGLTLRDTKTDVIWVVNMFKYQGVGEKNHRAAANHLATLHNSILVKDFLSRYPQVKKFYKDRVSHTPSRVGTQEQEQEQKNIPAEKAAGDRKKGEGRKKPTGDHAAFVDYFVTRWQSQYGAKYEFLAKDGAAAAKILKAAGTLDAACHLVDLYLGDASSFLTGQMHPLPILLNQINRFLAKAAGTAGGRNDGDPDNFVPVRPDLQSIPWMNRGGAK